MTVSKINILKRFACAAVLVGGSALAPSCHLPRADGDRTPGYVSTIAGRNGEFGEAFGVAVRGDDLYVSDGQAGIIWKVQKDRSTPFWEGLKTPSGLAVTADGSLVVADAGTSQVLVSDGPDLGSAHIYGAKDGRRGFADGDAESALFNGPLGVAAADDGKIYVADTYNDRIRVIDHGQITTLAGGSRGFADSAGEMAKFDTPAGIAVWRDKLLVADTGNRRIRVVEPNGVVWTLAGTGETGPKDGSLPLSGLASPTCVAVDHDGRIYICDANSVREIAGVMPTIRVIAGSSRGQSDGASHRASFNGPTGLAIEPDGSVLVADSENRVVRRISHAGGDEITSEQVRKLRGTAEQFRNAAPARWPFDPPTTPREIAGTLGEIRGEMKPGSSDVRFHNGLDVTGGYGETARFVRTEKVLRPIAVDNFGNLRESVRMPTMGYVHVRLGRDQDNTPFDDGRFQFSRDANGKIVDVRIPRGTAFSAGDPIGTLNAMNHVHLIAGRSGSEMNALDALILPGIGDARPPKIEKVTFYENETEIKPVGGKLQLAGSTRITVRAYDQMDGNADRRRLGLYQAGYQWLNADKTGLTDIEWNIRFDRMPPSAAVPFAYAVGSKSGATGETIFDYIVTNRVETGVYSEGAFDTTALHPGSYVVRVWAGDYFGNNTYLDTPIEINQR